MKSYTCCLCFGVLGGKMLRSCGWSPQKSGMKTMREDGERWLLDGTTTRAELVRVTKD